MVERVASCRCGRLRVTCEGDPVRISVCHCLNCQRRSGGAFAVQARFPTERVRTEGPHREWSSDGKDGGRATFRFCPSCGSTVCFTNEAIPGSIAVAVGAFADPTFPGPTISVYEERRHPWVRIIGNGVEHFG